MKVSMMLATISLFAFASAACAQDFHGRVTKEHVRIERPQLHLRQQAPMTSGISDNGFVLHAEQNTQPQPVLQATFSADFSNPFPASHHYLDRYPPSNYQTSAGGAHYNYAAAKQSYAAQTPFPGAPLRAWGASRAGFEAALQAYPTNFMDTGVSVGRQGLYTGERPRVAVDSCQCDMAIPSDACVRARMQDFGTNVTTTTSTSVSTTPWAMHNTPPAFSPASMHHMR